MDEIWKDVIGWDGFYQIRNKGNVRSIDHVILTKGGYKLNIKGKFLSIATNKWGYSHVTFWKNRTQSHKKIHLMVARAFIPNPNQYTQVHHKDGNKRNNNYWNLEWVENRENCTESHDKKRCTSKYTGVNWHAHTKKWVAQAYINKKHLYLGLYSSEEEASLAYQKKLKEHGIINRYAIYATI